MKKCEQAQAELEAYISNDIDDSERIEIQTHLEECRSCSGVLRELTRLSEVLQSWKEIEPSPRIYEMLKTRSKKANLPLEKNSSQRDPGRRRSRWARRKPY